VPNFFKIISGKVGGDATLPELPRSPKVANTPAYPSIDRRRMLNVAAMIPRSAARTKGATEVTP